MLFIEYDVDADGYIDVVALVNAVEEEGADPDGAAWIAWRRTHEDGGHGCAPVPAADLAALEATEDADQVRAIVERVVLSVRAIKEAQR